MNDVSLKSLTFQTGQTNWDEASSKNGNHINDLTDFFLLLLLLLLLKGYSYKNQQNNYTETAPILAATI